MKSSIARQAGTSVLDIRGIAVAVGGKTVATDTSLRVFAGAIHALMGPNGSGKSSIAYAIAGHPDYAVTAGSVHIGKKNLLELKPEERAREGLFLSFQEPPEVGGVSMRTFLATIQTASADEHAGVTAVLPRLGLAEPFLARNLNDGFSGGEKKKSELLQMLARKPKFAILDEIDAGLDVDALKGVVAILKDAAASGTGLLVISHAPRLFRMLVPDAVTVLMNGVVVAHGGRKIIEHIETAGYAAFEHQ